MPADPEQTILEFPDATAWERWLDGHHATAPDGVWLLHAKRGVGVTTVTHQDALDVAVCFGWIDAQRRSRDEIYYLQRFTPRRPRSRWSQRNRAKATALIEQGRMRPSGLAEVQAAQRDGRWEAAYPAQSEAPIPEDFGQALDRHPEAKAFFATLSGARRYSFLHRLHHVSRPEARARRIADYIERLSQGRTLHD